MSRISHRPLLRPLLCAGITVLGLASSLSGQTTHLQVGSASVGLGETATVEVTLASSVPVQGWSFGLCHDPSELELVAAGLGSAALALNSGTGPEYSLTSMEPGGVTTGAVVCFTGCEVLGPSIDDSLLAATYTPLVPSGAICAIELCPTLGTPPIDIVTTVGAESLTPGIEHGSITVESNISFKVADVEGAIGEEVIVPLFLTSPVGLSGVQVACNYDPLDLFFIEATPAGVTIGADFFTLQAQHAPGEIGVGVIQDLVPPLDELIADATAAPMMELHFFLPPNAPIGSVVPVEFAAEVGSPPIANRVVLGSLFDSPTLESGSISVIEQAVFVRGDANGDTLVDLADPIFLLAYLFLPGGTVPECFDSCDFNDDGENNAADVVFVIEFLFAEGVPPSAPFPLAGPDPTEDPLDCGGF